jgi:hypothetical protein
MNFYYHHRQKIDLKKIKSEHKKLKYSNIGKTLKNCRSHCLQLGSIFELKSGSAVYFILEKKMKAKLTKLENFGLHIYLNNNCENNF